MEGNGLDGRCVSRAGRPTALKIKGQTQNSFFQTGMQGIVNQSPSTQNECKCGGEGPDANPGTNAAPHQPGVSSEPSGCAGAALCHCPVELEQLVPCQSTLIPTESVCTWAAVQAALQLLAGSLRDISVGSTPLPTGP